MPDLPNRLLVVDDELASRTALSKRLIGRGYAVDTAEDGTDALGKILQDRYDLVLLDHCMPDMTGLDLLKLLRATHSQTDLPVIMVTGRDDNGSIVEALNGGANDYVIKPVEMPEISARIQAQLSRAEHARTGDSSERDPPGDAIWEWDPVSEIARFPQQWVEFAGTENAGPASGLDQWFDRVHPLDLPRVRLDFQAFLEGVTPGFRSEHRMFRGAGRHRWVLCRAGALRDPEGRAVRVAGSVTDIDQRKTLDPLTGLGNRQFLEDAMASKLPVQPLAGEAWRQAWMLLLLDVNGLREYNDRFGQEAGDRLLMTVAERLQIALAAGPLSGHCTLARCGGDEFAVLACCTADARAAGVLAEALLDALFHPLPGEGSPCGVTANVGVTLSELAGATLGQMMTDASLALAGARAKGPNQWRLSAPDLRHRAHLRVALARDLRFAVERKELVALYQPQISLASGKLTGFEALMRWRHPERGLLPPSEFISIAEETGLIVGAGEWILGEACRQLRLWQDRFPSHPPLRVAVNLSPRQLNSPRLIEQVRRVLEETGIPPAALDLEITESCMFEEQESAQSILAAIRATGVRLALDDFGTGYASLAHLKMVHFDTLKIDRSFVARMDSDEQSLAIVKTILGLAQELRMSVVAEGIESEIQLQQLIGLGCQWGQGFYFARPLDAQVAEQMLG